MDARERLARRDFLRRAGLLAGATVAVSLVVACGGAAPTPPAASSLASSAASSATSSAAATKAATSAASSQAAAGAGGTLVIASTTDPGTGLDVPNVDDNPGEQLNHMVFENLVKFNPKLELVPGLAETWEQSKDGITWTFKLRKGVKFHDGSPFNAQAAKASFDRLMGPEKPLKRSLYEGVVKSVEASDDYTLKFNLERPFAFFLNNLAHSASAIVNQEVVKKLGPDIKRNSTGAGTGPFKFQELVLGDRWVAVANDEYWGGRPKLDKVIVKVVPEGNARVLMLEAGDAQAALHLGPENVARLEKNNKIKLDIYQSTRALYIGINNQKKPFDNMKVRQALNYAVDKTAIVKSVLEGLAVAIPGPVAPTLNGYADVPVTPYDPEKAKALLAEAGLPNGFQTTLWTPKGRWIKDFEMVQAVQQQLGKVGVQVKLETMEWAALIKAVSLPVEENKSELFMFGWSPSTGEGRWAMYPTFGGKSQWAPKGSNRFFYSDPDFDELLTKATTAVDTKDRDENLKKAQELIVKDAPAIFLIAPKEIVGMSAKLSGLVNLPLEMTFADEKTALEK